MCPVKSNKVSKAMKPGSPAQDPSHNVWRSEPHPLDAIFAPRSVAVIGATDRAGSVGRAVLWSLVSSPFGGTVYPVSDKRTSVLGIKAYKNVGELPEAVDLAVIVTPAATVPTIVGECVKAGIRGAIVISAGFKEHGEQGKELERQILQAHPGYGAPSNWAELPGRDESHQRVERHLRFEHCAPGKRRLHQPKRGAVYGDSGLGAERDGRL